MVPITQAYFILLRTARLQSARETWRQFVSDGSHYRGRDEKKKYGITYKSGHTCSLPPAAYKLKIDRSTGCLVAAFLLLSRRHVLSYTHCFYNSLAKKQFSVAAELGYCATHMCTLLKFHSMIGRINRHNIVWGSVCGESKDVDSQTVGEWKRKLASLIQGYQPRDVFNGDETVLVCRAIPTRTLAKRKEKCVVGIEIPFQYNGSLTKKSWMTAAIMEEWLHGFNLKMKNQNRKVLLFLDNATCHPHIKLSNASLIFFPANNIDKHHLTEIENRGSLTELTKKIIVRNCDYWVARAAKEIRPDTVRKCFVKAGLFQEIEKTDDDEDNQPLNELADMLRKGRQDIDAEAVVSFDDDLSTEGVDRVVLLIHNNPCDKADQEDDGENNDEEDEILCAVRDLEEFAASKNCAMLVELMQDAIGLIEKANTVKQRTLMDK
ncbi:hypothetical protein PR048_000763 [Dryococelus australis]|uniref:DDE-1 domain-containing protein n=1 Tax=Dryococelus australis TaxID=614101 RepID=A0ABQ9IGF0_9NEOP|nr:hypothetical protein PR048_000763 [Dryococelus australis]